MSSMIFACGLSNYSVGFFHLLTHAFFKALLFFSMVCKAVSMSSAISFCYLTPFKNKASNHWPYLFS